MDDMDDMDETKPAMITSELRDLIASLATPINMGHTHAIALDGDLCSRSLAGHALPIAEERDALKAEWDDLRAEVERLRADNANAAEIIQMLEEDVTRESQ